MKRTFKNLLIAGLVLCTFVGILPMLTLDNTAQAAAATVYYDFKKANDGGWSSSDWAAQRTKFAALTYDVVAGRNSTITSGQWAYHSLTLTADSSAGSSDQASFTNNSWAYYYYQKTFGLVLYTGSRHGTMSTAIRFKGFNTGKYVPYLNLNAAYLSTYAGTLTASIRAINSNGSLGTTVVSKEICLADYPEDNTDVPLTTTAISLTNSEYALELVINNERTITIVNGLRLVAADSTIVSSLAPTNDLGVYHVNVGQRITIPFTAMLSTGAVVDYSLTGWGYTTGNAYVTAGVSAGSRYFTIDGVKETSTPQTIYWSVGNGKAKVNVIVHASGYSATQADTYYNFKKARPRNWSGNHVHFFGKHVKYNHTAVGGYGEVNKWTGTEDEKNGSISSAPWKIASIPSTTDFSPIYDGYGIEHRGNGTTDLKIQVPASGYYLPQLHVYTTEGIKSEVTVSLINSSGTTVCSKTIAAGTKTEYVALADKAVSLSAQEYTVRFNKPSTGSNAQAGANYYNGIKLLKSNNTTVTLNPNGGTAGSKTSVTATYGLPMPGVDGDGMLPTRTGYRFGGYYDTADTTDVNRKQYYTMAGKSNRTWDKMGNTATLYASWNVNTYHLVFNANGGSGSMSDQSINYDVTANITANAFTRTGYTFNGWNTKADGTGTAYANKASVKNLSTTNQERINLYAQWKANTYTVTLDNQSATTAGSTSVTATYGSAMPSITKPTKTGYTFGGYYTETNGSGTQYYTSAGASAKNWDKTAATTLYAKWTLNTYTITYNLDGGSVATANPTSYNVNSSAITLNNPTKTGYTFNGWTGSNGSTAQTSVTIAKGSTGNKTYTANWTANTYTVKYNGNTNTGGSTVSSTHTYGKEQSLTTNGFTKTGYTFQGWDTNSAGTTVVHTNGKSVTNLATSGTVNLYAVWKANTYTVAYNANGGSGTTMTSSSHTYDSAKTLTANTYTRSGYTFNGWNTKADGSGTAYADKASVKNLAASGTVTLYAQWELVTYNITYTLNSGTQGSNAVTEYNVTTATFSLPTPTRKGYTFGGWYTASDFSGSKVTQVAQGSTGDKTFYAKWTIVDYTITYKLNSGTQGSNPVTSYNVTTATFSLPTPTRTGYTFGGWYTASDFSGTAVTQIAKGTTGNKTYYAKWTANTYTVTFNNMSATEAGTESVTVTYDSAMPGITAPVKTGYTFNGYYDHSSGGTKYYNADGTSAKSWDMTKDTTLYAQYTANTYTVTLSAETATEAGTASVTATFGSDMPSIAKLPVRTGYTFAGFYDATSGGTKYYNKDGSSARTWNKADNATLYARWTANQYTVTYNANGGTGTTADSTHKYGTTSALTANGFTKEGYTFIGWAKSASGAKVYNDGHNVKNLTEVNGGTVTLYAVWQAKTSTVTLSEGGIVTATYDSAMTAIEVPKKAGKVFTGYYDGEGGTGTCYYTSTGTSAKDWDKTDENVTLYAKWKNATVTLNAIGDKSIKGSSTLSFTISGATDSGMGVTYSVTGLPDGATSGKDGVDVLNATTGVFTWKTTTSDIGSHTVTFTVTDGDVSASETITIEVTRPVSTVTLSEGGTVQGVYGEKLPAITPPKKAGKVFDGYYREADGVGSKYYNADGTPNISWNRAVENVTIYAKWIDATVTISEIPEQSANALSNLIFNVEATTDSGMALTYTVTGLPEGATFSGNTFSWTPTVEQIGTHIITFTATDGDISATTTVNVIVDVEGSQVVFKEEGNKVITAGGVRQFTVIATSNLGLPVTYSASNLPNGATFNAATGAFKWETTLADIGVYNVTFTATDGYSSAEITVMITVNAPTTTITLSEGGSVTATYNKAMPAITVPTKTGFVFEGYYDGENGTGTKYYNADATSAKNWDKTDGTAILYANWVQGEVTITQIEDKTIAIEQELSFNVEASSTAPGGITYTAENLPEGATFNEATGEFSWTPTADQTGEYTIIFKGSDGLNYAEVTVNVVVNNAISTVTFDENDDIFEISYGATPPNITAPKKSSYIFDGYYDGVGGTGTKYYNADGTPARKWDKTDENVTLYAKWLEGDERLGTRIGGLRDIMDTKAGVKGYRIYLFAGIDSLNYKEVGFEVTVEGTIIKTGTKYVYQKIKDSKNTYTPGAFGPKCNYAFVMSYFFGKEFKDANVKFRPYAIDHSGNYIYGKQATMEGIYTDLVYDEDDEEGNGNGDLVVDGEVEYA